MDTSDVQTSAGRTESPLIDVREPEGFEQGHALGAVLLPMGEVEDRIGEIPTDQPVYVICASGGRSAQAAGTMRHHGIDAVSVEGGTRAWAAADLPMQQGR